MPEVARLTGKSHKGSNVTLVLTDTDLTLVPDAAFRAEIEEALREGKDAGEKAPGVIGWIVEKALGFATHMVEKIWAPHPLASVDVTFNETQVRLHIGHLNFGTEMVVDPTQAYIFDAKLRQAKAAAAKH